MTATLDTVLHDTKKRRAFDNYCRVCAELVFAYWSAKYDHGRAILDDERERYITRRLRENDGDVSELLWALDGGLRDEWVMGTARNARHKNDGITYLFQSRERVEQLADLTPGGKKGRPHPMAAKYLGDVDVSAIVA